MSQDLLRKQQKATKKTKQLIYFSLFCCWIRDGEENPDPGWTSRIFNTGYGTGSELPVDTGTYLPAKLGSSNDRTQRRNLIKVPTCAYWEVVGAAGILNTGYGSELPVDTVPTYLCYTSLL